MTDTTDLDEVDLESYFDEGVDPPPRVKHSASCIAINDAEYTRLKFYTLPSSCIRHGCTLSTWTLSHDKSHLKLHSGVALQHALQELITLDVINPRIFYQTIECHREAVYESLNSIKQMHFSQRRNYPIKINGKILNYKNEQDQWVFYINSTRTAMGKLTIPTSTIKILAIGKQT